MLSRGLRKNPSTNFNLISINDKVRGHPLKGPVKSSVDLHYNEGRIEIDR